MMDDKKGMCGDCSDGGHSGGNNCGRCDHCLVGKHHGLARILLCLAVLFFVFWIGLAMGELKSYLRGGLYDGGYGMNMMWGATNPVYRMMPAANYEAALPSTTSAPRK